MTTLDVDLDRALEELEASFDILDLEQAWVDGLRRSI